LGGGIGAFAGSKLASPAAIKQYLKAAQVAKPIADIARYANESPSAVSQKTLNRINMMAPNLSNTAANSAWNMMRSGGQ
jgi:hypothetical protein